MTKMISGDAKLEFQRTVVKLLGSNPFYAHMLMAVRRQFTTDDHVVPTACVTFDKPPRLIVNEQFFLKCTPTQRIGVLEHEILHLVFRHNDNTRFCQDKFSDGNLLMIAWDLVVNQLIDSDKLIKEAVTLEKFQMPPNKTAIWYYNELKKMRDEQLQKLQKALDACGGGGLGGSPQDGNNKNGGCCRPGQDQQNGNIDETEDALNIKSLVKDAYDRAKKHEGGNGIGKLPGAIKEYIESLIQPPKVPWNKELRNFRATLGKAKLESTTKRISKRFGTVPGTRIRGCAKILVAIDTSGSVSNEDLKLFSNEIRHMHRNGALIEVVECDTAVNRHYPYRGKIADVVGRGGTDLREIFNWIKQKKKIFDGLVILTDGFSPMFPTSPIPVRTLWVINKGQKCADWGKTIFIE